MIVKWLLTVEKPRLRRDSVRYVDGVPIGMKHMRPRA